MKKIDLTSIKHKKTALVLSGGVSKAASWHTGVALALEELGFSYKNNLDSDDINKSSLDISTYVGSSAGSIISIYLAEGYSPQDIINASLGIKGSRLKKINYSDMFHLKKKNPTSRNAKLFSPFEDFPYVAKKLLDPFLKFNGFFSTEGLKNYLEKHVIVNNDFRSYKPDLFIVATQLDHSRKVIFNKYNYPNPSHDNTSVYYTDTGVSDAAAASMSVPPFFSPHPIKNVITGEYDYYIDGEIRDTLSTHVAEDNGCEVIISSWTHSPYHYFDEVGSLANYGVSWIILQSIFLLIQKKIVTHRANRATAKDVIDTVHNYLTEQKFSPTHKRELLSILETKLNIKKDVRFIDIYPDHQDYKTFFSSTFSLSTESLTHTMKMGYKKTMEVFQNLEL